MRYAELRDAIPDISDRMLSERLRELESEGIVARLVIPDSPVRVEYELTDKGRALERALAEIGKWAERWCSRKLAVQQPHRRLGITRARGHAARRDRVQRVQVGPRQRDLGGAGIFLDTIALT